MSDINLVVLGDSDSEFWNWGWFFDAYSGVKDHVTQQNDYACTSKYTGLVSSASPKEKKTDLFEVPNLFENRTTQAFVFTEIPFLEIT